MSRTGQSPSAPFEKEATDGNHPRSEMSIWKWRGAIAAFLLTSAISGYDVSNVANIQPHLYEVFGNIELLPWIGLSYSLANFAFLSFARKIAFCFNMKWVYIAHLLVFIAGAAVSGAAESLDAVIVGRFIMGWGGSVVQQTNLSYISCFATAAESPKMVAMISSTWAIGLVVGGPIGSAFAENEAVTWRWAFFLNLPLVGIALLLATVCTPSHSLAPPISIEKRLAQIDPLGVIFNIATPIAFALATTFSGPVWPWGSAGCLATWIVFGLLLVSWGLQQGKCIFTTPEQRAFPMHMFRRGDLVPLWIASGCAGAAYAVTLYYVPLFFAFARGHGSLQQTVRLLPFILVFVVVVFATGACLPVVGRYKVFFIFAGIFTLTGAAAMSARMSGDISEAEVMAFEALIGVGLGMHFQHALGISNAINETARDRVDSNVICNMFQMGGIAIVLSIAGCIFQNIGYGLLVDALGTTNYAEKDLREALAGVSSAVWRTEDVLTLSRGIRAFTDVIAQEFYIVIASGALCLLSGIFMRWQKINYNTHREGSDASGIVARNKVS